MEEAEYLCDEIAVINRGKIMATDTPAGLKEKHGGVNSVEIKLKEPVAKLTAQQLIRVIVDGSLVETPTEETIRISSSEAQALLVKIIEMLSREGIQIDSVSVNPPSLEEVFLRIVGEERS
jgi:ABC-2 type transport system ATP-binding protein